MSATTKGVMVILDGLGDRGCRVFDGLTPLEAASTPNLDQLLKMGQGGLLDPLFPGVPVGTHIGSGVLMGLSASDAVNLARGPVEAAGIGLALQPGDVVLRCNFATLERCGDGLAILDRRAGRIQEGTWDLASVLRDVHLGHGIVGSLHPATQHRAVLHLRGPGLAARVSDTDPGNGLEDRGVLSARALDPDDRGSAATADAVNQFIQLAVERLGAHPVNQRREDAGLRPANGIISRSAGHLARFNNLVTHVGCNAAVVTGETTVDGLGRLFDYKVYRDDRFNALPDTDLDAKVATTLSALANHDLVFLHIKGPDICAHDHDPLAKMGLIERIDAALAPLIVEDLVIGVTGDHSTDCNSGRHCGDPVPALLYAPLGRRDHLGSFGERGCAGGGLGRLTATSFLTSMLDAMGLLSSFKPGQQIFFAV